MTERRPPRAQRALRLVAILGGVALVVIAVLTYLRQQTLVELTIETARVGFDVAPRTEPSADGRPRIGTLSLFDAGLETEALQLQGACAEVRLEAIGRVTIPPLHDGRIEIAGQHEPFPVELSLRAPTSLTIEALPGGVVRVGLRSTEGSLAGESAKQVPVHCPDQDLAPWTSQIQSDGGLSLHTHGLVAYDDEGRPVESMTGSSPHRMPEDSIPAQFIGATQAWVSLATPRDEGEAASVVAFDPATGEITAKHLLHQGLGEAHAFIWRDQLLLVQPTPRRALPLLHPDLGVHNVSFLAPDEEEVLSPVVGGSVRFPAGDGAPVALERGFFLTARQPAGVPLTLRSIHVVGRSLAIVLYGEIESLRVGPTVALQTERLPSRLEWLYTHKVAHLLYGTLAWVAGAGFGLFKILKD